MVDYDEPLCIKFGQDGRTCGFDYISNPREMSESFLSMLTMPLIELAISLFMLIFVISCMCCFCYMTTENGLIGRLIAMKLGTPQETIPRHRRRIRTRPTAPTENRDSFFVNDADGFMETEIRQDPGHGV